MVLVAEGFGIDSIRTYLHKVRRGLERVVLQNPLIGLYLPFLSVLGVRCADLLMARLSKHIDELQRWIEESRHNIERIILSERRSNLVSLALASKYFLDVLEQRKYRSFVDFYVNTLLVNTILGEITRKYYDDLDVIEKTSLLYLYEVVNSIRERLGQPLLDTSQVKNYLGNLSKAKLGTFIRLAVAPFLYELSKLRKNRQYLLYFYELLSHIDFHALASEIRKREEESIEELSIYDLDEESIKALSIPLGDVELTLTAKFINTLQREFIHVPLIDFTGFISSYYDIPKTILKLWLWLRLAYYHMLKYFGYILILAVSLAVSLMMLLLKQPIQLITPTSLLTFISLSLVIEALKRLQQVSESRIAKYFKQVRKHAIKKIEELECRKKFFNYFVP